MNYNSMYDVYQELCAKYPNIPLAYDDSQDCVTVGSDNYSVTAYSNCGQGSVMISDNVLSYQYDSGSLADTEGFLSDLVQGKVQFSLAKRGQSPDLKINGWKAGIQDQETDGKAALISGVIGMAVGALFTLFCLFLALDESDIEYVMVGQLFLGLFASGLFNTMYSKKVKLVDAFGYFAGVTVTTLPVALTIAAYSEGDIPGIVALILSAAFFGIGHIVRNSFVKRVKQKGKEILLKCLPGPGFNNQNMQ